MTGWFRVMGDFWEAQNLNAVFQHLHRSVDW